jgi:hypothetical protein
MRTHLQNFDFRRLFVDALGWNRHDARIAPTEVQGVTYTFTPIAQQGGMVVVTCTASDGNIPPSGTRRKIDRYVTGIAYENLIIFLDRDKNGTAQTSLWWWVKREDGKSKPRTHTYRRGMSGDALLQKLAGIAFAIEELDDDGQVSIATVTRRAQKAFDVETVTRKFYDQFRIEHTTFLTFLTGLPDGAPRDWYASVMLNRLMFLYFIQKKRFLNGDPDYLRTKLEEMRDAGMNFYRHFLLPLFFDGLAREESERPPATARLLGNIPYLNGGLFLPHPLETQYGDQIAIADDAFERLFAFFDAYTWHLDDRPLRQGNEINPDVLGYIFEKYINQKQMGAYYTKEDITGYICRSTILPFLLDRCGVDVRAMMTDVEPYIYDAVATEDYLPTETEREYRARRARFEQIKADFAAGKIAAIDDLVTYNLDIQALTEDWLRGLSDPTLLRRFYFECLTRLTVLDPTCGSGAFLFAAIAILEPLYELALDKMRQIVGEPLTSSPSSTQAGRGESIAHRNVVKYLDFADELQRVSAHPNRRYYVLKRIIVNNLYGVDIMDEAVEICKLRLFLKMVAQVDDAARIEPLPDIDFNIRAGNTLVGFATRDEIEGRLFATPELKRRVGEADRALRHFRDLQTRLGVESGVFKEAKAEIEGQMTAIRAELDEALMQDYGLSDLPAFRRTHKPFHWYVEFNSVLANGGFDVIVGNPPYVEYSKVRGEYTIRGYITEHTGNIYAFTYERTIKILKGRGRIGLIVPLSIVSTERMKPLQQLLLQREGNVWFSHFDVYPSKLFEGAKQRLTISLVSSTTQISRVFSTVYNRWKPEERETLIQSLYYSTSYFDNLLCTFPKTGSPMIKSILRKIGDKRAAAYHSNGKNPSFYVHRIPYNYVKAIDYVPYFWNSIDGQKKSEDYKPYYLHETHYSKYMLAVLNSNLFFWWWYTLFEGYHCGRHEIFGFPAGVETMTEGVRQNLETLSDLLMADYRKNAKRKTATYKTTGRVEYDEFYPRLSKPIIDEIDRVLARHYGFTDEELDFIIHYDIKYRMGRDAED